MAEISLVRVLKGAAPFSENNVNDTYRGLVLKNDGSRRHGIIKDLNLSQLTNELLARVLGESLGLPIPDAFLGIVLNGDVPVSQLPLQDGSGHLVFVSGDVGTPNLAQQVNKNSPSHAHVLINCLKDWLELGGLYAFDTWIANTDRHAGNLLIDGPSNIWLIDHGHAFTGPTWTPQDLDPVAEYRNKLYDWLTQFLSPTEKTNKSNDADLFTAKIAALSVDQALSDIMADQLLTPTATLALKDFLSKRINFVPMQAKKALGVPVIVQ